MEIIGENDEGNHTYSEEESSHGVTYRHIEIDDEESIGYFLLLFQNLQTVKDIIGMHYNLRCPRIIVYAFVCMHVVCVEARNAIYDTLNAVFSDEIRFTINLDACVASSRSWFEPRQHAF